MKTFVLFAIITCSTANAATLNCLVEDSARVSAGLPLHSIITDLSSQNSTLVRRSLDSNGQLVESPIALISNDKVSTIAPTDRRACTLHTSFNDSTRRGGFSFTCGGVLLQYTYDLRANSANYWENFGSISKTFPLRDCAFTP